MNFYPFVFTLLFAHSSFAVIQTIKINSTQNYDSPRWMYNPNTTVRHKGIIKILQKIRASQIGGKYQECLALINANRGRAPGLQDWMLVNELNCARKNVTSFKRGFDDLEKVVKKVEGQSRYLLSGAVKSFLRTEYSSALLDIFEHSIKRNRRSAWETFDKLVQMEEWLDTEQMAKLYRLSGELAFIQQDLVLAFDYFQRSLSKKDEMELRKKIDSIRTILIEKKLLTASTSNEAVSKNVNLAASDKENELVAQMQAALAAGDLVAAVDDGVDLIKAFPAGVHAHEAADRLLQIYVNVAQRSDPKYDPLLKRIFRQMRKMDSVWRLSWAKSLVYRGLYEDGLRFLDVVESDKGQSPELKKILLLKGLAALYLGDYEAAKSSFKNLVLKGAGTEEGEEALFRLGLVYFRQKNYSEASAQFERLLVAYPNSNFLVEAKYWLWRSTEKFDANRAQLLKVGLAKEYPLTYYGLRANSELNGGKLSWSASSTVYSADLRLTSSQLQSWEKAKLLMRAGWFKEAQEEIRTLPVPLDPQGLVAMAHLWFSAFDHHSATTLLHKAWNQDPSLRTLTTLRMAYPFEFSSYLKKYGEGNSLEEALILALIKQESSFRIEAKSSSGALGLMQLMPATAQGVSERLNLPPLKIPEDLFQPETNIRLGTSYLSQMLRAFNGHLPLALAAYNAGIGRMRRWLALREEFKKLSSAHTSNPELEVWIDELPWAETSHYVKAVLRNLIMYRLLGKNVEQVNDPVWK